MNSTMPLLPEMQEIWHSTLQWQPSVEQQNMLQKLYTAILAGNRHLNLTRITEPEEFWEKHVWDSWVGIEPLGLTEAKVIDIGSGAGFPGFPVAIFAPMTTVTLLDSTRKKMDFLADLVTQLNLNNVTTVTGRAEAIGQQLAHRQVYDLALVRAVGSASVCAEYALPLVNLNGQAVLYRGNWSEEESQNLVPVVKLLGGEIEEIKSFTTPISKSIRHCIYLRKVAKTPAKFPRGVGIPKKQPL